MKKQKRSYMIQNKLINIIYIYIFINMPFIQRLVHYFFYYSYSFFSGTRIYELIFPAKDKVNHIIDNIYLGDYRIASNYSMLKELKLQYIINCTFEIPSEFPNDFQYLNISIEDSASQDITHSLDEAYMFITQHVRDNNNNTRDNILVHCVQGKSRSASIVIYYLMKKYNYTYDRALELLRRKRSVVNPNKGFEQQLRQFEQINFSV